MGLTRGTTRAHLVRASLESIAYQSRDVFDAMCKDASRRPRALRVDGGATVNNLLMQMQADIMGVPVERPRHLETTALGAMALAANACGLWPGGRLPGDLGKPGRRFVPKLTRAQRQKLYDQWCSAVKTLLR
jgi:glycerol kinase